MNRMTGPGVRVVGRKFRPNYFLALVADPEAGEEVEVRYDRSRPKPFRCQIHGRQLQPSCEHSMIAHQLITTRKPTKGQEPINQKEN